MNRRLIKTKTEAIHFPIATHKMSRMSARDREHLMKAFEEGQEFIPLTSDIGVSRPSFYRIIRTFCDGYREALSSSGPTEASGRHLSLSF